MNKSTPNANSHPLDIFIGNKVSERRKKLRLSQKSLGKSLSFPVTFQQIQKYEKGTNRISASTLFEIATILKTNISYFVEGYTKEKKAIVFVLSHQYNTTY